jgi:hypothetical protein
MQAEKSKMSPQRGADEARGRVFSDSCNEAHIHLSAGGGDRLIQALAAQSAICDARIESLPPASTGSPRET